MKVRDAYLWNAQVLGDSGSLDVDLDTNLKIQHIALLFKATNGSTSNTVGKLKHWISKIEIVDGSDALCSLSGREVFAFNCYHNRMAPFHDLSGGANVVITDGLIIEFGRFKGDREYYLDTSRYKNPKLRITWAYTVSTTAGIATGTGRVSAIARIIEDGALPYKGFFMRKEVDAFTSGTSGKHNTDLALDYPYSGLLVQALITTVEPDTVLTNYKLTRNTDQFIDFDRSGRELYGKALEEFGEFAQKFRPLADTAATWLSDLYFKTGGYMSKPGATSKGVATSVTAEQIVTATTTGGTADAQEDTLKGGGPAASLYLPFGDGRTPDDFLNPTGLSSLKLIMDMAVAAACAVCTEQLRV